jgi:hypothetical protein
MGNGWLSVRDEMDTTVSMKMLVVLDEPTVMSLAEVHPPHVHLIRQLLFVLGSRPPNLSGRISSRTAWIGGPEVEKSIVALSP